MSDDTKRPIVVKKIKKSGGGAHGGAWKIAYADFVTAMMAFFMLMWLLGSTTKADLKGIADYFQNPLKVSLAGGSGSGDSSSVIQGGGKDLTASTGQVKSGDVKAPKKTINLQKLKAEYEKAERTKLQGLKGELERFIEASPVLKQFKNQLLRGLAHEVFFALWLDAQNRLLLTEELFRGTLTQTSVYPREVVKKALANNAGAVILAHNHPSGLAEPSSADITLTATLKQALGLIDVKVLDHFVVVSGGAPLSFAERGLI